METLVRFGPADHGRMIDWDDFVSGDCTEGFQYEIIEGRLYVSPLPGYPHDWIEQFVLELLRDYSQAHPDAINKVTNKARVFVPGMARPTAPEPDIAAYRGFPRDRRSKVAWRDVSPILVVEILSADDVAKDLVRNVELYLRVPTIQEYWVFDNRDDSDRPTLRVYRRTGEEWTVLDFGPDDVYTSALLPGLELPVTPTDD